MNIMTKRGNLDNIVTYEHICDTQEDLVNIPLQYTTLGSVALVIKGDDDALEACGRVEIGLVGGLRRALEVEAIAIAQCLLNFSSPKMIAQ